MKLEDCRKKIDAIDAEIIKLLIERGEFARKIGQIKIKAGLPILDAERENEVLQKAAKRSESSIKSESLVNVYRQILQESRRIQIEEIENLIETKTEIY